MSTLGKNDHQREAVRAGETLGATVRTPGQGGKGKGREADDWRTAARMLAIKEGELWRQQPLTDWWPQWSAEDSETLRGYLMHSNTRWSRNVPSFMITPQGQVNMSWGGAGRVPLLVVDQLRGDDDDIEPPQHPECTYTALKRVWLRNLTVIARSLPRADIDWGHLHDYGKALRLSVISACNIMHSPHPRNYHTRVAMWELAQEPQPAPLSAEQVAFKAHREKRIREAQKRHQSLEAHWRRTMRNFQRRAQAAEIGNSRDI